MRTSTPVRVLTLGLVAALAMLGAVGTADAAPPKKMPAPSITAGPANGSATNSTSASFSFTSVAGAKFTCSLDGAAYTACTSPKLYTGLASKAHTFSLRATATGYKGTGTASRSWTVDTVPPAAPTVPAPSTPRNSGPALSITGEAGATFRCSVDGAAAVTCASGFVASAATDGPHTASVTAVDAAGNSSAATVVAWLLDTSTPTPVVTSGPASTSKSTTADFAFYSDELSVAFQCQLDAQPLGACPTSSPMYTGLSNGGHTFKVVATDPVGNTKQSAPYVWTVDTSAPVGLVWSGGGLPAGNTSATTANFHFTVTGAAPIECRLDGVVVLADCSGGSAALSSLADGSHTFTVAANPGATEITMSYTWTVDTVAPGLPTLAGPSAFSRSTSANVTVTPADPTDAVTCTADGVSVPCYPMISLSALAQGSHTVQAVASDPASNQSIASLTWTVDTVAPTASVAVPTTVTGPATVSFSERVTAAGSNPVLLLSTGATVATARLCRTAALAATSCTGSEVRSVVLTPTAPLVPGESYVVSLNRAGTRVTDLAGNANGAVATAFRGALTQQEDSRVVAQSWRTVKASGPKGGSYLAEKLAGARVSYAFTGTAITWYPVLGPTFGLAYVYVDNVKKATVNSYSGSVRYGVARTVSGLANARHTLTVVVAGLKGSTRGKDSLVGFDAVKVGATLVSTPAVKVQWQRVKVSTASGSYRSVARLAGAGAAMTFRGTGVTWLHSTGTSYGKANVYIDGHLRATVDSYATSSHERVGYVITGLTNVRHTIRVVVLGTKRSAAKGTTVTVDAFVVR